MKTSEKVISALLTILLGVMFIVMRQEVISVAMTVFGVVLIILGIMNLIDRKVVPAVIKIVLGALIIVFGWVLVSAVLYIIAALLLIYGILLLYSRIKLRVKGWRFFDTLLAYAEPVVFIVIAFFLFFNQGGTLAWVFIVSGIFTVVEGILMLIDACWKR